ncbi:MAG: ABC transporter ATP-binding protein [Anaerolineae bacterium]|nr:ABC transporter ATP-binding protein [Anaerolineae bacterium]
MQDLLDILNLKTHFQTQEGTIHAVNGVSLSLSDGETLGIVGESGCGKSVTMMSLLRLIPMPPGRIVAGSAHFFGRDLLQVSDTEIRTIRGSQIGMIFQDPMTFFNPVIPIGKQVAEPLEVHRNFTRAQALERAAEMLEMVGIPRARDRLSDYPHQFSGGMRQRAMIAMALICNPKLLIADEPTTALDVTIQAQIIELVLRLREELGMSIIWITHDLGVVAGLAQRIAVMYAGYIIEEALVDEFYANPQHPYAIGLLGSLPRLDANGHKRLVSIDGLPPVLTSEPNSCPFAPRCWLAMERCQRENPQLRYINDKHRVACWVDIDSGKER